MRHPEIGHGRIAVAEAQDNPIIVTWPGSDRYNNFFAQIPGNTFETLPSR
jgi:hypothetical protein